MPLLIDPAEIESTKRRTDLVAFLEARGVTLQRRGRQLVGRCPLHSPDKTPSFYVDPKRQVWQCFGACTSEGTGDKGDVIRLEMRLEGVDFVEAVRRLGGNVPARELPAPAKHRSIPPNGKRPAGASILSSLDAPLSPEALLGLVVDHYHRAFLGSAIAQKYAASRGLGDVDLAKAFRLGYADGSLLDAVPSSGSIREGLVTAGVLTKDDEGRVRELLGGCLVVPMLDERGAAVDLYGRSISGSRHLYLPGPRRGLVNRKPVGASDTVVLAESILDALSFVAAGIAPALGLYGVNGFTAEHAKLLAALTIRRVFLALDSDEPGQKAAAALSDSLEAPGREVVIVALPFKDPNAMLAALGPVGFRETWERLTASECPPPSAAEPPPAPTDPAAEKEARRNTSASALAPPSAPNKPVPPPAVEIDGSDARMNAGQRVYTLRGLPMRLGASLRVAVKFTVGERRVVDTVDLYASRSRAAFVANAAETLSVPKETVEADLERLLDAIEARTKAPSTKRNLASPMTPAEREEAMALAKRPDLLDLVAADMDELGYVGEPTNKKLAYLVAVSRKLRSPLSMIVLSQSGSGKSGLSEIVEKLTPPEEMEIFSRVTPAAFYYLEKDTLVHKLVLIEERAGSVDADYSIRALQSKGKLVIMFTSRDPASGRTRSETNEVLGPTAFIETTTASHVDYENGTRCFEVFLDESEEQTRRIHARQRWARTAEGKETAKRHPEISRRHQNLQRLLRPVDVDIPFASLIEFPASWVRTRRDNDRFLSLIEVVAFLCQHQRPARLVDGVTRIEATIDDYAQARELAAEVLGHSLSNVRKPVRALHDELRTAVERFARERKDPTGEVPFTRADIVAWTRRPYRQVRELMPELVDLGLVLESGGGQGRACVYRLSPEPSIATSGAMTGLLEPAELLARWEKYRLSQANQKTNGGGS